MPIFFGTNLIGSQCATQAVTAPWWDGTLTASASGTNAIWVNVIGSGTSTTAGDWGFPMGITTTTSIACQQQAINMTMAQQRQVQGQWQQANATRPPAPTAAEIEAHRAAVQRSELRNLERQVARERARGLLLEHLTPAQRKTFEKNAWFVVEGGRSKKRYRIEARGVAGNVYQLDQKGHVVATFCGHADHSIPDYDQYLAQKLMLEANEDAYLALANRRLVAG